MRSDPPLAPNLEALHAQGEQGAHHRRLLQKANAALAASPAPALLERVQTIHRIMLATDPKALRRSVSWFGRLLARDITLQAEAEALRSQLGVHVLQARQQLQTLVQADRQLQALGLSLQASINELGQQSLRLAGQTVTADADDDARRLQYLATLATSLKITASHLDLTVLNHHQLCQRVEQMLPRVELLLDQEQMLRAGLTEQTALQSAVSAIDALHSLPSVPMPDVPIDHSAPDDATPR